MALLYVAENPGSRQKRLFRDRIGLENLRDFEIMSRYRLDRASIAELTDLLRESLEKSTRRSYSISAEVQKMPPKPKCSCQQHANFSSEEAQVFNISTSKKIKRVAIKYLIEQGWLKDYHKYICAGCYEHALCQATTEKYSFSEFCEKIGNNLLSEDDFLKLSVAYGKLLSIRLQGAENKLCVADMLSWKETGVQEYPALYAFLNEIGRGKSKNIQNTMENILTLSNQKYIGTTSMAKTVITYMISGSRQLVELNAMFSPSGGYKTVLEFLKNKAMDECKIPTESDIIYFFDNNQIMARSWRVQFNSKPLISVVTTVVGLVPPEVSNLQETIEYLPGNYCEFKRGQYIDTSELFRKERNDFIYSMLSDDSNTKEPVKKKIKIEFKNGKPTSSKPLVNDPYDKVPSKVQGKTNIIILPPVLVNPCSFESLEIVLDEIVKKNGKSWVMIGCDGLPFLLCSKMIDNYFICPHCCHTFKKIDHFKEHMRVFNISFDLNVCRKYKNVLLIPGFGHIDINTTKALFKLLWVVCIKKLALLLGWKSIKALSACENCTDHHKATQILHILFDSCSKVLINQFKLNAEKPHTIEHFYMYAEQQNDNFKFLFKITFTYLMAWKILKIGMRRANFDYMKMSMDKLSQLFYGFNMTSYMDIWIRFENFLYTAPEPVVNFVKRNICLSQSGHQSKAEGGDFILETVNKKIKSYMPQGVPTEERWTRVCATLENIEKIKKSLIQGDDSIDGENVPNQYFRRFEDKQAVEHFSEELTRYLESEADHTSMTGEALDFDIANFDVKCSTNKEKYYESYPNVLRICERVFLTPDDRRSNFDIKNKTRAEIKTIILNLLQVLVGLRFLAKGSFYSEVADLHGISRSSVCIALDAFVNAVNEKLDNIRFPFDCVNRIKYDFYGKCGLPNVIGAVDGTLIPIQAPSENEAAYVCRKGYHALNMQAIVDSNMRFMDIVAKWPGSQHDSFIFNNSGIKSALERRDIGYVLGDSGYALRSYIVTPVLNPSSRAEIAFNEHHGSGRSVVEKAFGVLKSRFRCLHKSGGCLLLKPTKCCKVAEACVRLHNFCLDRRLPFNEQDIISENEDNGGNFCCQTSASRDGSERRQRLINLFN